MVQWLRSVGALRRSFSDLVARVGAAGARARRGGGPGRCRGRGAALGAGPPTPCSRRANRPPPRPSRAPTCRRPAAVDGNTGTRWGSAWSATPSGCASTSARPPPSARSSCAGRAPTPRLPDPDLARRHHLDRHLHHHHRHRRHRDARRHRLRPLRADVRHRPRHRLRLLAVGVPGLRHASAPPRRPGPVTAPPTRPRASRPPRHSESAGTPAAAAFDGNAGTRWSQRCSATRSGSGSTWARPQTICQVVLQWEARVRHGVPDPDLARRHHLDDHLLAPPPAPAAPRR